MHVNLRSGPHEVGGKLVLNLEPSERRAVPPRVSLAPCCERKLETKQVHVHRFARSRQGSGGVLLQVFAHLSFRYFLGPVVVARQVDGAGARAEFKSKTGAIVPDAPLVLWVDGLTASASEVRRWVPGCKRALGLAIV